MLEQPASGGTLAMTAHWTAAVRALEHQRADRLVADPWAESLAGEVGMTWLAGRSEASVLPIVLRTRYFDDLLQRVTRENAIRQIVLLAAGLDTRAFRLAWPDGVRLFEIDQPAVLDYKTGILRAAGAEPLCDRRAIGADLTDPWSEVLIKAGFSADEPTGWLLEGFLFYLPDEAIVRILEEVTRLAGPVSWLGFDIINSATLTSPFTRPWVEMQGASGAPCIGTLDDPVSFLAERGWQAALTQAGQPDAHHGRWTLPVIPTTMPDMPHNWFVTAQRAA